MSDQDPELEAVLHRWINSLSRSDSEAVLNLLSSGTELRYIGTDEREWWSGTELARAFGRHIDELPPFSIDVAFDDVEAFSVGSVGWGCCVGTLKFEGMTPVTLRTTAVFVLEAGIWKIIQIHNSVGRPNVEVAGAELTTTLEELLRSMADGDTEAMVAASSEGTVTLVFTDIESSTTLADSVGDRPWAEVIAWHDATIRNAAEDRGGNVIKSLGDGALLAFSSVRAAARCAIAIQRNMVGEAAPMPIRVRIGIHIGDVVRTEEDVLGHTVNKAARIASLASGGQILVSSVVHSLLEAADEFQFGEAREAALKGLKGLHAVVPLEWE
jgi:class 3 adenylate cyclase